MKPGGGGTLKIVDKCKERNLPEPEFSEITGGLLVSFIKEKAIEKATQRVAKKVTERIINQVRRKFGEKFGESSEKILEIILLNKNISAQEIARQRGISPRAVEKHMAKLKKYGILKRIGPAKGGYWRVYGQD